MITKSKIVIIAVIVVIAVVAIVVGVVLGTRSYVDCGYVDAPSELKIEKEDSTITISWSAPEQADNCEIRYTIHYSLDNNEEEKYNTTDLFYKLSPMDPCSVLSVHVWALSESGQLSEEHVTGEYTENLTEVPPVTDIIFSPTADGVLLSYTKPEGLEKCNLEYNILVTTDTDIINPDGEDDSLIITDDDYCFEIEAEIIVSKDNISSSPVTAGYNPVMVGVQNLEVSETADQIMVSWAPHPKAELCSLNYKVVYSIEGQDDITQDTDATTATFDVIHCYSTTISVTAFKPGADFTSESSTVSATSVPDQIEKVTDLLISKIGDSVIAAWTPPVTEPCIPRYLVSVSTELGFYDILTDEVTYEIPYDKFCTKIQLQVSVIIAESRGEPALNSTTLDLEPIENLEIFDQSYVLNATWAAHPKQDICTLKYKAVYSVDGEEDVKETTALTIEFDTIYCSNAEISVTAFNTDIAATTEPTSIDATKYPNSIDQVTGLTFSESSDSLTASWTPVAIGTCTPKYTITVLTDTSSNLNPLIDETSYIIPEDEYCTRVQISVAAIIELVIGEPASLVETFVLRSVSDLEISISSNLLTASWSSHPKQTLCGVEYRAVYSVEGEEDQAEVTPDTVVGFTYTPMFCAAALVSVTPFIGSVDGRTISKEVTETSTEIGKVTNLEISQENDNLVASWTPVDVAGCTPIYFIKISTDITTNEFYQEETNYNIPQDSYCTTIDLEVTVVVGQLSGEPETTSTTVGLDPVTGLQVTEESNTLTVSWTEHPKQYICSLNYRVLYSVEDETDITDDTDTLTASFNTIYCSNAEISVTAHNIADTIVSEAATLDATQLPNNIEKVTNLILSQADNNVVLSWDPLIIGSCVPTYVVTLLTDVGNYVDVASGISYVIAEDRYCTKIDVGVHAVIEGKSGVLEEVSQTIDLEPIKDLEVFDELSKLNVAWASHPKQDVCPLTYRVVYSVDGEEDVMEETTALTIDFDTIYCSNAEVSVTAFNAAATTESSSIDATQYPTRMNPVTGLTLSQSSGSVVASWEPLIIGTCTPKYTITVLTDTVSGFNLLIDETSYIIPEDQYCTRVQVDVAAVIEAVVGEPASLVETFDLEPIKDLEVFDELSKLNVAWASHPKQDVCPLTYRVVYSVDGEEDVVKETTALTIDFDTIYCSNAQVSVTAFNAAATTEPSSIDAMQYPTRMNPVTGLSLSQSSGNVVASWEPLIIGTCTPKYTITVLTDTVSGFNLLIDETSYIIPEYQYCTRVQVDVAAVIEAVVGEPASLVETFDLEPVQDIEIFDELSKLNVAWASHPRQDICLLTYRVVYTVDGEEDVMNETTALTIDFDTIYCSDAEISVTALNSGIAATTEPTSTDATQYPNAIEQVTGLSFSQSSGSLTASWTPLVIRTCAPKYTITVLTDTGIDLNYLIDETSYIIPENQYCTRVQIHVAAVIESVVGEPASLVETFDLQSVSNVELEVLSSNELRAFWDNHPKELLCSLQYSATYSVDNEDDIEEVVSSPEAVFPLTYCATATVSVVAFNSQSSSPAISQDASQDPTTIGEVQGVIIDITDTQAIISWELPDNVKDCPNMEHTVTATNDENAEYQDTCTGLTYCIVNLDSFCPSTTVSIEAISIIGPVTEVQHIC